MQPTTFTSDYTIIGSGAAGLHAALEASRNGQQVLLVTKSTLETSSSYWAQGGIAAVMKEEDSFESHKDDTLTAGRGLCDEQAVDTLVKEGAFLVRDLVDQGMPFDRTNGALDLGLEGGHSHRRVLHANGAATGKALVDFLAEQVRRQPNITLLEHTFVFNLVTVDGQCLGAQAYNYKTGQQYNIQSPATILATGGYSNLYQRSTNPHTSTGDGLWLGYNAGCALQDLEFIQFHPTAFYAPDGSTFLISEAVRGEGARLYNSQGERFMDRFPQKELSPRDLVSREIYRQIQQGDANCVYLDVRHLPAGNLRRHFPNLIHRIEAQGIDISSEAIPVAPAAHYCIGGIATDLDACTSVGGLYACGEAAATGVHGANRLASNSLLECLVFSRRAIIHAARHLTTSKKTSRTDLAGDPSFKVDDSAKRRFVYLQNEVAALLNDYVGIQRDKYGLQKTLEQLENLSQGLPRGGDEYYGLRSRGIVQITEAITNAALNRRESRGVHIRRDFPQKKFPPRHSFQR